MALEKPIIKADQASASTFDYKPREFVAKASLAAKNYVDEDAFRSPDFKISDLVAQQAGISQLESDAHEDKINAQVLGRLKEVQEKAFEEGYELGLIEGIEKAFQETKAGLLERMDTLEVLLKSVEDLKTQLLIDNEAELIRLVFLIAKKIAFRDLEGNREVVQEILQTVVGEIKTDERVLVRLSAEDLYFLETLQDKSGKRIESLERIKFVAEDRIKSGGCLIETEYGNVDATIEERVERTWQTLQARIPQKNPTKTEE